MYVNIYIVFGKCEYPRHSDYAGNGFVIFAVANVDKDPKCDIWYIDEKKELVNIVEDNLFWRE
jgi:hypothetical protein